VFYVVLCRAELCCAVPKVLQVQQELAHGLDQDAGVAADQQPAAATANRAMHAGECAIVTSSMRTACSM
jgi:hypothetical protein